MENISKRQHNLSHVKSSFQQFSDRGGIIPEQHLQQQFSGMTDRMKNLLMKTMNSIYNWKDGAQIIRARLYGILKDGTIDSHSNHISRKKVYDAGYDPTMYDLELKEDFPPYSNDIIRVSVNNITAPGPHDEPVATVNTEVFFPHQLIINEQLPQEITEYIALHDPEKRLINEPRGGKHREGPPPYDNLPPFITGVLKKVFLDYTLGKEYTEFVLHGGTNFAFKELKSHLELNKLLEGILHVELISDHILRYYVTAPLK